MRRSGNAENRGALRVDEAPGDDSHSAFRAIVRYVRLCREVELNHMSVEGAGAERVDRLVAIQKTVELLRYDRLGPKLCGQPGIAAHCRGVEVDALGGKPPRDLGGSALAGGQQRVRQIADQLTDDQPLDRPPWHPFRDEGNGLTPADPQCIAGRHKIRKELRRCLSNLVGCLNCAFGFRNHISALQAVGFAQRIRQILHTEMHTRYLHAHDLMLPRKPQVGDDRWTRKVQSLGDLGLVQALDAIQPRNLGDGPV